MHDKEMYVLFVCELESEIPDGWMDGRMSFLIQSQIDLGGGNTECESENGKREKEKEKEMAKDIPRPTLSHF